jgi:hypothetical protein
MTYGSLRCFDNPPFYRRRKTEMMAQVEAEVAAKRAEIEGLEEKRRFVGPPQCTICGTLYYLAIYINASYCPCRSVVKERLRREEKLLRLANDHVALEAEFAEEQKARETTIA